MKNREIEKSLSRAVDQLTPHTYDKAAADIIVKMTEHDYITRQERPARAARTWRMALTAATLCCALVLGLITAWSQFLAVDSIIGLDVNPSIEITTNRHNRVLSAIALNADAEAILDGMELNRVKIDVAMNAIIGSMVRLGYFSGGEGAVLITIENGNTQKARDLELSLTNQIEGMFTQSESPLILHQTLDDEELRKEADRLNISSGRLSLIRKAMAIDSSLKFEDLADVKIRDLYRLAGEELPDIDDAYCDDCGKLESECKDSCRDDGEYCEYCGLALNQDNIDCLYHDGNEPDDDDVNDDANDDDDEEDDDDDDDDDGDDDDDDD